MEGQEVTIAIVVIVLLVGALLGWLFIQRNRTKELRDRYGEEYDRTLEAKGGRRSAEADLIEREERVKKLEIRPLSPSERDRFAGEWKDTKALFVDSPMEAVSRADRLLTDIMSTRDYPMADFEKRHADLTVEHADVAKHYLAGHEIADRASDATTEELRRAINHYEALFGEMTSEVSEQQDGVAHDRHVKVDYEGLDGRGDETPLRPAGDPLLRDRDRV